MYRIELSLEELIALAQLLHFVQRSDILHTTPVTAQICEKVDNELEDQVKVRVVE